MKELVFALTFTCCLSCGSDQPSVSLPKNSQDSCGITDIITVAEDDGVTWQVGDKTKFPFSKYDLESRNWELDFNIEYNTSLFCVDSMWQKNRIVIKGKKLVQLKNTAFAEIKNADFHHDQGVKSFPFSLKNNGKEEVNFMVSIGCGGGYVKFPDGACYLTESSNLMFLFVNYDR